MVVCFVRRVRRVVMMRVTGRVSSGGRMHRIGMRMSIVVRVVGRVFGAVFLTFVVVPMVWHRIDLGYNQQNKARANQKFHFCWV